MFDDDDFDSDRLREDLKSECYGAYFGGGFGGALIESFEIDSASDEELIDIARKKGINLSNYF